MQSSADDLLYKVAHEPVFQSPIKGVHASLARRSRSLPQQSTTFGFRKPRFAESPGLISLPNFPGSPPLLSLHPDSDASYDNLEDVDPPSSFKPGIATPSNESHFSEVTLSSVPDDKPHQKVEKRKRTTRVAARRKTTPAGERRRRSPQDRPSDDDWMMTSDGWAQSLAGDANLPEFMREGPTAMDATTNIDNTFFFPHVNNAPFSVMTGPTVDAEAGVQKGASRVTFGEIQQFEIANARYSGEGSDLTETPRPVAPRPGQGSRTGRLKRTAIRFFNLKGKKTGRRRSQTAPFPPKHAPSMLPPPIVVSPAEDRTREMEADFEVSAHPARLTPEYRPESDPPDAVPERSFRDSPG